MCDRVVHDMVDCRIAGTSCLELPKKQAFYDAEEKPTAKANFYRLFA